RRAKSVREGPLAGLALAQQRRELSKLRPVDAIAAEHQVMGQQPRLRVKNSLVFALVVLRRIVGHLQHLSQWEQRLMGQQAEMMRQRLADAGAVRAGE